MNTIIQGSQIGAFKTISLSIGQAKKANRDGKMSKFLVIGMKNKKSLLGKKQNVILFEEDLSPEIFETLMKYAKASTDQTHQGSFDVSLADFKASQEFASDPDTWTQLLEFPGGCFEEYQFEKGPCYANDAQGNMVMDGNNQQVIRSSVAVFVQIDFIDAEGKTHYIEPFSKNAQGARMESRFFRARPMRMEIHGRISATIWSLTGLRTLIFRFILIRKERRRMITRSVTGQSPTV